MGNFFFGDVSSQKTLFSELLEGLRIRYFYKEDPKLLCTLMKVTSVFSHLVVTTGRVDGDGGIYFWL